MFSENLRIIRKAKGFSQEELAIRLNVVRQTVSKWEKGLSVPDADMLIKISEVFETTVSELLGASLLDEGNTSDVTEQLSRINEQLAIKNRRTKTIWKTILIIIISTIILNIFLIFFGLISFTNVQTKEEGKAEAEIILPETYKKEME